MLHNCDEPSVTPREVAESPSLEVFRHVDVALKDMV